MSTEMIRPGKMGTFLLMSYGMVIGRLVVFAALVAIWEFGSGTLFPKVWVSSPSAIIDTLMRWIDDGSLWRHLWATLLAAGSGYLIGSALGIMTGVALGIFPRLERIASPFLTALYSLPKVALAPMFVIFLGIGLESKIALVAVTVYFLILYNTLDGVHDLDQDLSSSFRLMGATDYEVARKVLVPGIQPWIFSGLRIGVRYAFTAAVLGELIAGNQGVGFLIEQSAGNYSSSGVFAGVLVLVICSVLITELITHTEASVLHWRL